MINLYRVKKAQKKALWNILQKYLYEMTNFYSDKMDKTGSFPYEYFDAYFFDKSRKAFFIYSKKECVGFVMINNFSYLGEIIDHSIAEFTIFPQYRKMGIAAASVNKIFNLYTGRWEIKYSNKNLAAKSLWKKVTFQFNPKVHHTKDGETILSFDT